MSWRVAHCIATLQAELHAAWPDRSTTSDGTVGDAAHAARTSQHNPADLGAEQPIVTAIDVTRDDVNGPDLDALCQQLLADPRCWYVIYDRRIWYDAGLWEDYHGSNPHTAHLHLSVAQERILYDDARPWVLNLSGVLDPSGDDMPYRDWPKEDRDKLLQDITDYGVPHVTVQVAGGGTEPLTTSLFRLSRIETTLQQLQADLMKLDGKIEALLQMPSGTG